MHSRFLDTGWLQQPSPTKLTSSACSTLEETCPISVQNTQSVHDGDIRYAHLHPKQHDIMSALMCLILPGIVFTAKREIHGVPSVPYSCSPGTMYMLT